MNKRGSVEPINLLMGLVAIMGAILIIANKADFGLILLIIATLIEAITRVLK